MKLTLRATALIVLLLAAAAIASANSIPLTLNNGGSDVMGGVFVGPYNFTTSNGQSLQLVCDDSNHDVYQNESWKATTSTLPALGSVVAFSTGQFSGSTLAEYEEVAYVAQQIFLAGPSANAATIGYMQYALWDIFTCSNGVGSSGCASTGLSDPTDQVGYWFGQAQNNYQNGNYSDVVIYTPVAGSQNPSNDGLPQEYIGIVATPEPSSLALLIAGMLALMLLVIRRGRA